MGYFFNEADNSYEINLFVKGINTEYEAQEKIDFIKNAICGEEIQES